MTARFIKLRLFISLQVVAPVQGAVRISLCNSCGKIVLVSVSSWVLLRALILHSFVLSLDHRVTVKIDDYVGVDFKKGPDGFVALKRSHVVHNVYYFQLTHLLALYLFSGQWLTKN